MSQITTLGLSPSFGYGDRLGTATPGHVAAHVRRGGSILPIFAQQSIREMTRTNRTPQQVVDDALAGAKSAGYTGKQGGDADHLKTPDDVNRTAAAGFVFFTIDPSGDVDPKADTYDEATLRTKFGPAQASAPWLSQYKGKSVKLSSGTTINFDEPTLQRAAVKYGKAIQHAVSLSKHIDSVMTKLGKPYEIEISVDETPEPTTPAEHYIVAEQCLKGGMKLVSLAPRFVGEFEKGVDYKGDIKAFEKSLNDHAAVAKQLGPYKLSLHSGSDKLSIYPAFARATGGMFHVKTAGTSYLEALRVVARHDEGLFRKVVDFSRGRYETDRATYHVSAKLSDAPPASDVREVRKLEDLYLGNWVNVTKGKGLSDPARQILHTTFGSVLTDPTLGPAVKQVVRDNPKTYKEILDDHFGRHLDALRAGL